MQLNKSQRKQKYEREHKVLLRCDKCHAGYFKGEKHICNDWKIRLAKNNEKKERQRVKLATIICPVCKKPFAKRYFNQKYCSHECYTEYHRLKRNNLL